MYAQKPARIEVTVGWMKEEEKSRVHDIYHSQWGDPANVGTKNTFVARDKDGLVVGTATIDDLRNLEAGLVKLRIFAVDRKFERRNIGSQMLEAVLDELKRMDYKTAEVVLPFSRIWEDFFRERGFSNVDKYKMRREL